MRTQEIIICCGLFNTQDLYPIFVLFCRPGAPHPLFRRLTGIFVTGSERSGYTVASHPRPKVVPWSTDATAKTTVPSLYAYHVLCAGENL